MPALPQISIKASLATLALIEREPFKWLLLWLIFVVSFCPDECAMGFHDSCCLFFDLFPFVYLLR